MNRYILVIIAIIVLLYLSCSQTENYYNLYGGYVTAPFKGDDSYLDAYNYRYIKTLKPGSVRWFYPYYYPRYHPYWRPYILNYWTP